MKQIYYTVNKQGKANEPEMAEFLSKNGQMLLPTLPGAPPFRRSCSHAKSSRLPLA